MFNTDFVTSLFINTICQFIAATYVYFLLISIPHVLHNFVSFIAYSQINISQHMYS